MTDYYEYAIPQLVKLLGARFKDYRLRSNMTQKEVSEQSGLTVTTIHKFESGCRGQHLARHVSPAAEGDRRDRGPGRPAAGAAALALPDQEGKESATHKT